MMREDVMLRGSSTGLSVIISRNTTMNFLLDRQQGIRLGLLAQGSSVGYVWKRVFLKGRGHRD